MRNAMLLIPALAILSAGCASGVARRLDAIDARLAAIEAKTIPSQPPATLNELAESARVARARRDVIVSNLANVETIGFKRRDLGGGDAVRLDVSQGPMQNTDRPLDVAISGHGLFRVTTAAGVVAYTRNGNFFSNPDGELVLGAKGGPRLTPTVKIPANTIYIRIGDDGTVEAVAGDNRTTTIGRIELVRFANAEALRPLDANLFVETPDSGPPIVGTPKDAGFGEVHQGFLEGSTSNRSPSASG